ncbi:GntR family transcriptional regulator [Alteribacillus sp. JSM 102045]|uniref:GntR family transcriptional regulator n=1 Tax=Alteribacillus sp. JSM 102045 TaxID=1562101 RepID=UPI0035C06BD2
MIRIRREEPLYEQIYQSLIKAIIAGEIESGKRLTDTDVASTLGVSRSPVREAFRKLERDGLLVNKEGAITVFVPSLEDVLELYQVRMGLESVAAYWSTKNITSGQIEKLQEILFLTEEAIEMNNPSNIVKYNTLFHESIVLMSQNNRLKTMMDNISSLIKLCRNTIIKQHNRGEGFLQEHYEIFHAIQMNDSSLAAKKMKEHILNDMEYFKSFFLEERADKKLNL